MLGDHQPVTLQYPEPCTTGPHQTLKFFQRRGHHRFVLPGFRDTRGQGVNDSEPPAPRFGIVEN